MAQTNSRPRPDTGPHVPNLAWLGAATLAAGLIADVVEHAFIPRLHDAAAAVALGQLAAHLATAAGVLIAAAGVAGSLLAPRLAANAAPRGRATPAAPSPAVPPIDQETP